MTNWRFEVSVVLVWTVLLVGLGLLWAAPVESARPVSLVRFERAKPRPRRHRLVLRHPGRAARHLNACPGAPGGSVLRF